MARRKTNEEFVKEVYDLVGDEYIFLDKYIDSKTKIKCKHNQCGKIWSISPNNFLRGHRCPYCCKNPKWDFKDVIYFIEIKSQSGCKLLSEKYINNKTKLKIRCKCGNEFITDFVTFRHKSKRQCDKCTNTKLRQERIKSNSQFLNEVYNLVGNEYIFLENYNDARTKIKCKHNIKDCGYEWLITPMDFLKGSRCPKCNGNAKKTQNDFLNEVYQLVGNDYTVIEIYKNARTPIKIRHNKCGTIFNPTPNNFLRGTRCPRCMSNTSEGEKIISKILDNKNIKYEIQYILDDCKNKNTLPFDFYLPDYNLLIEYDGIQHFEPVDFAGKGIKWAKKRLKYTQLNDNIKNQYCKDNNIPLLRIPYWEFDNIEKILDKWLSKYGLIHNENIKNVV